MTNVNACCSQLTTDISKENKGRVATNTKQTTSYGKKEKPSTLLLARKKGKVLCDVIPTSSKFGDLTQTQPIPNKRPKVVLSKMLAAGDEKTNEATTSDANIDMRKSSCAGDELSIDLPIVDSSKIDFIDTSNPPGFDPDVPCCSHQMFPQATASISSSAVGPLTFPTKLKKFPRKPISPATATPTVLSNQASPMHVKTPTGALKLRNSFAGVGTSTGADSSGDGNGGSGSIIVAQSSLLRAARRSSLGKDGRKLKKKKSLKADSTLIKRKKSRVF